MHDSKAIRHEIDRTVRHIDETLHELGERAQYATRTAVKWGLVAVAAASVCAATLIWYMRRRRAAAPESTRTRTLPFHGVGVTGRRAESRPSA